MKNLIRPYLLISALLSIGGLSLLFGCDSGEEAIEELTGKKAVERFQKTKKNIEKISDKQKKKYDKISDAADK
jgi:hypothetical protein